MHRYIEQAAALAGRAAQFAAPEAFGSSTTCSEFDVQALAEHMLGFARLTAHTARKTLPDGDRLEIGAGWQGVYRTWIHEATSAWSAPGALEGSTSFGGDAMPAERAAAITVMEFAIHAWDMARTFEAMVDVPPDVAKIVRDVVEQLAAPGLEAGVFGLPLPVTSELDAFERALALSGRNPNR